MMSTVYAPKQHSLREEDPKRRGPWPLPTTYAKSGSGERNHDKSGF